MYTITLGVNDKFEDEPYYTKRECLPFDAESARVNELFRKSGGNKVFVEKKSVSLAVLISHMIKYLQVLLKCILIEMSKFQTKLYHAVG